jgi:hypothetical protein
VYAKSGPALSEWCSPGGSPLSEMRDRRATSDEITERYALMLPQMRRLARLTARECRDVVGFGSLVSRRAKRVGYRSRQRPPGRKEAVVKIGVMPGVFALIRLPARAAMPEWLDGALMSVTRTDEELSIVVDQTLVPVGYERVERGWRALVVEGPLDLSQVGVLASISQPLARSGVSIFALSTYNTDYVLVRSEDLDQALEALREGGHELLPSASD